MNIKYCDAIKFPGKFAKTETNPCKLTFDQWIQCDCIKVGFDGSAGGHAPSNCQWNELLDNEIVAPGPRFRFNQTPKLSNISPISIAGKWINFQCVFIYRPVFPSIRLMKLINRLKDRCAIFINYSANFIILIPRVVPEPRRNIAPINFKRINV